MSDMWRNLIGDMSHSLIGGGLRFFFPRYVASFKWPKCFDFQDDTCQLPIGLPMSLLTCAGLLIVITYTCRCVIKFVIDCTLWTW